MWTWFSNFLENAFVSLVNRRMCMRMVRFWRSTNDVEMCFGGVSYWLAREIAPALGYPVWAKFTPVIERAMAACAGVQIDPDKHFVRTGKLMEVGGGAQLTGEDYFLSRPAASLTAMNGDPSKPEIAGAQAYFTVQTRRMEVEDQKSQDMKRLEAREKVTAAVKRVSGVAKAAGVRNDMQGVFHDQRWLGLYGKSAADVKVEKGLKPKDNLFDRAGPIGLSRGEEGER
jgi:DNA-damage-inducible protein D